MIDAAARHVNAAAAAAAELAFVEDVVVVAAAAADDDDDDDGAWVSAEAPEANAVQSVAAAGQLLW